jgi:WD40 repeat protein
VTTAMPPMISLAERAAALDAGAYVVAAGFLGGEPAFALGDGALLLGERRIALHDGAVLCAAFDGKRLLTGGDDGAVLSSAPDGAITRIAEAGGWVDAVASGPDGAIAWSVGKKVFVRDGAGKTFEHVDASTARGLAFAPKGFQLAIARYNGVTLWFPRASAEPKELAWKGSHVEVTWSPDGRFVVTTMQEPALHGWRVADGAHMRMTGYPGKVRSIAWSGDGKWLATSGADAAIVWPFAAKEGPMGKPPVELSARREKVTRVAFHPGAPLVAIGYEDGMVVLSRMPDGAEILLRKQGQGGPVSALAFDAKGTRVLFGTEGGAAGLVGLAPEG